MNVILYSILFYSLGSSEKSLSISIMVQSLSRAPYLTDGVPGGSNRAVDDSVLLQWWDVVEETKYSEPLILTELATDRAAILL